VNGQQVAAHICFEDVFGEEMAQTVANTDTQGREEPASSPAANA
jgi:hypothetical protein